MRILEELPNELGLSPFEVVTGFVFGPDPDRDRLPEDPGTPRQELEGVVLEALQLTPCCIAFSGGRDSSAILALATHLARREGLPEPIALSRVHPGVPRTDEAEWQELVVSHLRVADWQKIVVTDELGMLDPIAIEAVRRHGPLHPAFGHLSLPIYQAARGGVVLTGEGGDEFFDIRRRVFAEHQLKRLRRRRTRANLAAVAYTLAPTRLRRPWQRHQFATNEELFRWMPPEARAEALRQLAHRVADEPLGWSPFMRWVYSQRWATVPERMADLIAADAGSRNLDPLYHPRVMAALANDRPLRGHRDRSAAYRAIFGSLLPDAVWDRVSKASFNDVVTTERARDFARSWDGSGLESDLVDVDGLRREWEEDHPHVGALALLQLAAIATRSVGDRGS